MEEENKENLMKENLRVTDIKKEIKEEKKKPVNWYKLAIIFIVISCLLLLALIIVASSKFKNKEDSNPDHESTTEWEIKGDRIKTQWAANVDPKNPWPEYPRPQIERKEWMNLNGLWDYFITDKGAVKPEKPDGKILVPYPLESALSGVMKSLTENQELWYQKSVKIPSEWKNKKIILNFGAVDWKAEVFINFEKVGEHIGGFTPFSFDITNYIQFDQENEIVVKVFDPTNTGYQPIGKQTKNPEGIWYTSVSGIWQTVWLEPVEQHYITNLKILNDFDSKQIGLNVNINSEVQLPVDITISYGVQKITTLQDSSNKDLKIDIQNDFYAWSPDEPNMYTIEIILYSKDRTIIYDKIKSYTCIRKVTKEADSKGILRIKLNGNVLFNMGTLDQGWYPDGLYTAATEEAMVYDIKKLKDLGFNTIRKHVKVEPSRYYYFCDKIGILLWQDMPSGNIGGNNWDSRNMDGGTDVDRTQESKDNYYQEWTDIIHSCEFFQCIIIWTPFNEAWGQFETEKVAEYTRGLDPSRLINSASGGNHRLCGDILDLHNYPEPDYYLKNASEINVLGEYGGLGLEIKGHTWKDDNWGYVVYKSKDEVTAYYEAFAEKLITLAQEGFSAAIYTQTTDVESEINGLITYDRYDVKIFESIVKAANEKLIKSLNE